MRDEAQPQRIVLVSSRVVVPDGQGGVAVRPAAVSVEGSRIVAVSEPHAPRGAGVTVHDFGERVLAPAFVNAHTHLAMCALRGVTTALARRGNVVTDVFFRAESLLTAADVRAFTRVGAYECLLSGTAEVWDHYYFGSAVAEALADVGLAGVVAPTLQDLAGPGRARWESELEATERIAIDRALAERGIFAALGPHATDTVSPELFRRVKEAAERLGLPVHLHAAQSFEEVASLAAREGLGPIEYLARSGALDVERVLLAHGVFASRRELALLDPERHWFAVCPFSQVQFAFPSPVEELVRAGLSWVIGTDCVASNDSMSLPKELALIGGLAALRAGSSEAAREHAARGTLDTARALEEERRLRLEPWATQTAPEALLRRAWGDGAKLSAGRGGGVIAPGALAHVVVYDTDHPCFWPGDDVLRALAYADTAPAIHALVVSGRFVGRAGDFHASIVQSAEYREAVREAEARRSELLARLGS
jgi:5-methylthioadenosine/S-adenosylhomocysteine deaminase